MITFSQKIPKPNNSVHQETKANAPNQAQPNFCTFDQRPDKPQRSPPSVPSPRAHSETRKKYSFEDEENGHPFNKKEYFLKGGDDVPNDKRWLINNRKSADSAKLNGSLSKSDSDILESTQSDSKLVKPSIKKKAGVTFHEKLEVHEVKNPHYGMEIKSEKREMKKKKKDKRKEEDAIIQIRLDMKAKIQNENMILYNVSVLDGFLILFNTCLFDIPMILMLG